MTAAAQKHITTELNQPSYLENQNYGIEPEKPESKQYIFTEKKSGKFSKTNYHLLEKNPLAKAILSFVLAMAYKEGDDFLFVLASYASRCGKSLPTVRKAIHYLIELGHCIMIRHVGQPTEFFFSKYPFTTEEKNFLRDGCMADSEDYAEYVDISEFVDKPKKFVPCANNFLRDGCRSDIDSEEENLDISETDSCEKKFSTATYLVNLFLLYINNNSDNNINSAKPVPTSVVVVDKNQNISEEKNREIPQEVDSQPDQAVQCSTDANPAKTPAIEKNKSISIDAVPEPGPSPKVTGTPPAHKVKAVIGKIPQPDKDKLSEKNKTDIKKLLFEFQDRTIDELADRTIHAIRNGNKNIPGFLRKSIIEQWDISVKPDPISKQHPPPISGWHLEQAKRLQAVYTRKDIDAHCLAVQKAAERERAKQAQHDSKKTKMKSDLSDIERKRKQLKEQLDYVRKIEK